MNECEPLCISFNFKFVSGLVIDQPCIRYKMVYCIGENSAFNAESNMKMRENASRLSDAVRTVDEETSTLTSETSLWRLA